jgi:signal transduction histidine kinase
LDDSQHALNQLRDLAHGIYPAALATDGLPGALEELAVRTERNVRIECDGVDRLEPEVEVAIYFCCVEALANATRQAAPGGAVTIRISHDEGVLSFRATYWLGDGVDPIANSENSLQIMADRIGALGGWLDAFTGRDGLTRVVGSVPTERQPQPL